MNDDIFHISRGEVAVLRGALDAAKQLVSSLRDAGMRPMMGTPLAGDEGGYDAFGRNTLNDAINILDRFDQGGR